jgi:hypothetical protein
MAAFIPGLALSERLYRDAVRPVLAARYPRLAHSAARLDYGSDVLESTRQCGALAGAVYG